jgi:hypothetical protein
MKLINKFPQRRSQEEFQAYLRELFDYNIPNIKYHWYFSTRKKRDDQNYAIYAK